MHSLPDLLDALFVQLHTALRGSLNAVLTAVKTYSLHDNGAT